MSIDLPLPMWAKPPLMANDRHNRWQHARIIRESKADVLTMARSRRLPKGLERVSIGLTWVPETNRRRDSDGPAPTLKACVDALVEYGLVVDDDTAHVLHLPTTILPADPNLDRRKRLWLTIETLGAPA